MAFQAGGIADDKVDVFRSVLAPRVEGDNVFGVGDFGQKLTVGEGAAIILFFEKFVKVFRCDFLRRWLLHGNI